MTAKPLPETAFWVPGVARPQGSKRHVGRGMMIESSPHLKAWRSVVTIVARAHLNRIGWSTPDGPISVSLTFLLPRPQRPKNPLPITPPDIDKLARAALDGLTNAGAYADDKQVTELVARKQYAEDTAPGMMVRLANVG